MGNSAGFEAAQFIGGVDEDGVDGGDAASKGVGRSHLDEDVADV